MEDMFDEIGLLPVGERRINLLALVDVDSNYTSGIN